MENKKFIVSQLTGIPVFGVVGAVIGMFVFIYGLAAGNTALIIAGLIYCVFSGVSAWISLDDKILVDGDKITIKSAMRKPREYTKDDIKSVEHRHGKNYPCKWFGETSLYKIIFKDGYSVTKNIRTNLNGEMLEAYLKENTEVTEKMRNPKEQENTEAQPNAEEPTHSNEADPKQEQNNG